MIREALANVGGGLEHREDLVGVILHVAGLGIEGVKEDADIEIDGRITVVDGKKAKIYMKNFGEFFENQVEHASTIVISRTQMMKDEKIEECVHILREKNPDAAIISTPWEELGKEAVQRALEHGAEIECILEEHHHHEEEECCDHEHHHHHHEEEECCDHEHHHHHHDEECCDHDHHHDHGPDCTCGCHDHHDHHGHHHADEVFTSWGKETAHKYTEDELDFILKALTETEAYGTILRAKGIIQMEDGSWKQFDMVPEEFEIRAGQADYTGRLCVIGTDLKEDELMKLFHI